MITALRAEGCRTVVVEAAVRPCGWWATRLTSRFERLLADGQRLPAAGRLVLAAFLQDWKIRGVPTATAG